MASLWIKNYLIAISKAIFLNFMIVCSVSFFYVVFRYLFIGKLFNPSFFNQTFWVYSMALQSVLLVYFLYRAREEI